MSKAHVNTAIAASGCAITPDGSNGIESANKKESKIANVFFVFMTILSQLSNPKKLVEQS